MADNTTENAYGRLSIAIGAIILSVGLFWPSPEHGYATWIGASIPYLTIGIAIEFYRDRWLRKPRSRYAVTGIAVLLIVAIRVLYIASASDPSRTLSTILWTYHSVWNFQILMPFAIVMAVLVRSERNRRRKYLFIVLSMVPFVAAISRGIIRGAGFGPAFTSIYFVVIGIIGGALSLPLLLTVSKLQ